jgi:methionyl-tRNA formyltransferase
MKIVFMGTPRAAVPTLARILADGHEVAAVYTQPDRPSGRGNRIGFSSVKEFAIQHGLNVLQPTKIKTAEALEIFRGFNADVAVVVAYGRILPATFLSAFPMGAINVHFSLLPKYRGAAPVNWAIVNGESRTGVTTMQMDVGLDTGDILLQRATEIGAKEDAVELVDRLADIGAHLLSETLMNYSRTAPVPQNDADASFAPLLKKEDGLADWDLRAVELENRVRGFQPFPGVFTFYNGSRLSILKAKTAEEKSDGPEAGQILTASPDVFEVACGGGTILRIEEIQPEGKRRMSVRDFINGTKPKAGDRLSDR